MLYKNQFKKFDIEDQKSFPEDDLNLFVGSSTFRRWTNLQEDFLPKKTLNRGFGGSTMEQLLMFNEQLITKYKFKKIFIYEGDNDVGRKPEKIPIILEQFKKLVAIIHEHQPEAQINYLSIKCSPFREKNCENYKNSNIVFKNYCETEKYLNFIDITKALTDENGEIIREFFNEKDGIHPSEKGYKILAKILMPHLYPVEN
ncbi:MAG: hypothetical protein JXR68_05480 [Bacteroidales bacterium]|nr:hypothetical protein [Bacteroidales bacterium]